MDTSVVALLSGAVGVVLGAGAILAGRWGTKPPALRQPHGDATDDTVLPAGVVDVLAVLRSSAIVLDPSERVVDRSAAAVAYGLVRGDALAHNELVELSRVVRRDRVIREVTLELPRGPRSEGLLHMLVRVAPLGTDHVLLLCEDLSESRRVDEVRRDFIANVSHELKTPVGGLALLAEAVAEARDDPEAVERFARRMQVESVRLGRLVREIVDLSRLQASSGDAPEVVDVGEAVGESVRNTGVSADLKGTELASVCEPFLRLYGDHDQIVTAIGNLLTNAVAYSEGGTRITVRARRAGDDIEIAVTDQGMGIPAADRARIFERFYRVDAARSRATGGTGLGLSIVKHICENHGGSVSVWSEVGRGSTFTMVFPAIADDDAGHPATATATD